MSRDVVRELRSARSVTCLAAGVETTRERNGLIAVDSKGDHHRHRYNDNSNDDNRYLLHCHLAPYPVLRLHTCNSMTAHTTEFGMEHSQTHVGDVPSPRFPSHFYHTHERNRNTFVLVGYRSVDSFRTIARQVWAANAKRD
jgi:hypothetical protein